MVFQNYALFPHMTVYENLAFPLRVRKIPKDEADKKIDKALSMVSLQGFEAKNAYAIIWRTAATCCGSKIISF